MSNVCDDKYVCDMDMITYDGIQPPCIAVGDNQCVSCDNVNNIRIADPVEFNKNPIKKIFNLHKSPEEISQFWTQLETKCGINRPSTFSAVEESPRFYVAEPEYEVLNSDYETVLRRIEEYAEQGKLQDRNGSRFMHAIFKVANAAGEHDYETHSDPEAYFKQKISYILESEQCTSQMTHKVSELPINIQLLFSIMAIASESNFIKAINYLNTAPQVCLEGVIDKCISIVQGASGGRRRHKTRKYKKRKSKSRRAKRKSHRRK